MLSRLWNWEKEEMSKLGTIAAIALLVVPAAALASQGSGTGTDTAGGGSYILSQGSGTGNDSIGVGNIFLSQGSGTGNDSIGVGDFLLSQGSGTGNDAIGDARGGSVIGHRAGGGFRARGVTAPQALRQHVNSLNCLASMRCLFNMHR